MQLREEKLNAIIDWSKDNKDVKVVLLMSSLVNPLSPVDELSDLDIELVFEDNAKYISDKSWIYKWGNPITMIEEDEACFDFKHAIKMVYDDYLKVDFKLYSKTKFLEEVNQTNLPKDWDLGYKVLVDKDKITYNLKKPAD